MKHLWFGLGILAVLLTVCLGAFNLLQAKSGETIEMLEKAQSAAIRGDTALALHYSELARDTWERHEGFIDIIMSHEETDDIHREFSDLLVYAENGKKEEFLSSCGKLLVMVNHLTEMERPIWRNLLCFLPLHP